MQEHKRIKNESISRSPVHLNQSLPQIKLQVAVTLPSSGTTHTFGTICPILIWILIQISRYWLHADQSSLGHRSLQFYWLAPLKSCNILQELLIYGPFKLCCLGHYEFINKPIQRLAQFLSGLHYKENLKGQVSVFLTLYPLNDDPNLKSCKV